MKTVKKYTTFKALKASHEKMADYKSSIKKHIEFERIIKTIYFSKVHKNDISKSK